MVATRIDIAKRAGVSPAVVSYVLNGGPRKVASGTRARVLAAIEELDYRPNSIARSLRTQKTMTLGLVLPDMSNPYFAELSYAVENEAFGRGYTLLIGNAAEDHDRQTRYIRTFLQRQVDGLILVPAHGELAGLADLEDSAKPWAVLDRGTETGQPVCQVLVDNRHGAQAATRHLIEHGRRHIACIAGPQTVLATRQRVGGWSDALHGAGLQPGDALTHHAPFGRSAGWRTAHALLDTDASVDGIFVASDEQALGVLRALAERGITCPDDIAVFAFDNIEAGRYSVPSLSTVAQPMERMAKSCLDHITGSADSQPDGDRPDRHPVALVPRASCGCPDSAAGPRSAAPGADSRPGLPT